jgi:hypothetical protein
MRTIAVLVFSFALFAVEASAQQVRHGAFTFGMRQEEAIAAMPGMVWEPVSDFGWTTMIASAAAVRIGPFEYFPALEFEDNHLTSVRYARPLLVPDQAACVAALAETVRALETEGAFSGDRSAWEPSVTPSTTTSTSGGSLMRLYPPREGGDIVGFANRRGALFTEAQSVFAMRSISGVETPVPTCAILVRYLPDPYAPAPTPVDAPSAAELEAAELLSGARFIEQPAGDDYAAHYPSYAMEQDIEGRVTLGCLVKADGYLRCAAESEEPAALGFAAAALRVSRQFRVDQAVDGAPTVGRRIRRTLVFRLAN